MSEKRTFQRPLQIFSKPGQVAEMVLADGFRFVALVRGERPSVVPINESGRYLIDVSELAPDGGVFPIGLLTVDLSQVAAIEKIPAGTVERMLDAAAKHLRQQGTTNA